MTAEDKEVARQLELHSVYTRCLTISLTRQVLVNVPVTDATSRVEVWWWIFVRNAVKCGEKKIFTAYFLHLFAVNAVNRGELFFSPRSRWRWVILFHRLMRWIIFFHRIHRIHRISYENLPKNLDPGLEHMGSHKCNRSQLEVLEKMSGLMPNYHPFPTSLVVERIAPTQKYHKGGYSFVGGWASKFDMSRPKKNDA